MARQFGFGKKDRLKSSKMIEELFNSGHSLVVFPLKFIYKVLPENNQPSQAGVAVSKRFFKKAVHRNRIKRLMKEAYRLQKNELNSELKKNNKSALLFIIYMDKQLPVFSKISKTIHTGINLLVQKIVNERPS
ncbi:MAG TPA: ribonuclease P protein component [Flavisolibacter sp.]|jgi:ribonuclease P protein component|nr:ribonuclease P protein component [Flavisolibacter sp.]